jgi:hypothetical protein
LRTFWSLRSDDVPLHACFIRVAQHRRRDETHGTIAFVDARFENGGIRRERRGEEQQHTEGERGRSNPHTSLLRGAARPATLK